MVYYLDVVAWWVGLGRIAVAGSLHAAAVVVVVSAAAVAVAGETVVVVVVEIAFACSSNLPD